MTRYRTELLLGAALLAAFILHALKFLGYPASVFPDEYTYIIASVGGGLAESGIPNFLFYAIYGLAGRFDNYLDAARVLNAFFFALSGPFVFAIARQVAGTRLALLTAILSVFLPFSWYTVFFMPESLFYLLFWFFVWFILRYRDAAPWKLGAWAGGIMAVSSLVKTHAIFWCVGFALFIVCTGTRRQVLRESAVTVMVAAVVFVLVKFGLGYALAGPAGLTLFGQNYNRWAAESAANVPVFEFIRLALYNAGGHLLLLAVFFGAGFIFLHGVITKWLGEGEKRLFHLAVLSLTFLAPLLVVDIAFATTIEFLLPNRFPPEITVIQTRYYSFLYPAFLILAARAAAETHQSSPVSPLTVRLVCLLLAAAGIYAAATRLGGYTFYFPLAPEAGFLLRHWPSFASLVVILALVLPSLAAALHTALAGKLLMYLAMPILCLYTIAAYPTLYGDELARVDPIAVAGTFYHDFLGDERDAVTIYDESEHLGVKLMYFMEAPAVRDLPRRRRGPADLTLLKPGSRWVIIIGGVTLPPEMVRFIVWVSDTGPALVRIADYDYSVTLTAPKHPWPVRSVRRDVGGFSVEYALPLPDRFTVTPVFSDGDTTAGAEFEIEVAGRRRRYVVGEEGPAPLTIAGRGNGRSLAMRRLNDSAASPVPTGIMVVPLSVKSEYSVQELVSGQQ